MQPHDVEHGLEVLVLLALRLAPGALWLGWPLRSFTLGLALALGAALSCWPLALRIAPADLQLSAASAALELARGVVLGLGGLSPLLALGWAGRLTDASRDALPSALGPSVLERLYLAAALAILFASGAHVYAWRTFAGSLVQIPLGVRVLDPPALAAAALELAKLFARAFELGVVLAAPVLFVTASGALVVGLSARAAPLFGAALLRGPLVPVLGLSAACLSISSILGAYPGVAQVFVDATRALLSGLR